MKVNRRAFLKLSGAAAAGAALFSYVGSVKPALKALAETEEPRVPGVERWVNTACRGCEAGCGLRVKVVDGRVIKIEGNPSFPTNQGGTCPKGQAGLQVLYDPDRIKTPMKRMGPRGSGQWARVSWEEAMGSVVEQLRAIRSRGEAHTLVMLRGSSGSLRDALVARFLEAFGTPNNMRLPSFGSGGLQRTLYLTQGLDSLPGFDLAGTEYLLSFGFGLAEGANPTAGEMLRLYGEMRRGRPGVRPKYVQVDARLSVSAAKADEWVPVNTGTEGALALGIAHVLIEEGLYDRAFVSDNTFGFDDWQDQAGERHLGFGTLVTRDYPPEVVAEITGVSPRTIRRLAREFGSHRPAVAVGGYGWGGHTNTLYTLMAVHSLNALVGSIGAAGGVNATVMPPVAELPPPSLDATARAGLAMPSLNHPPRSSHPLWGDGSISTLAANLLRGEPYRASVLLLHEANPVFALPGQHAFSDALREVPFIVSFSSFMDETTEQADLILPDHTYLERYDAYQVPSNEGFAVLGVSQPAVAPLYDTANTAEVLLWIAQQLGGPVAQSLPWGDYPAFLQEVLRGVHAAKRGSVVTNDPREFWDQLLEQGGWWDATSSSPGKARLYATPSGKFEFYSQALRKRLEQAAQGEAQGEGVSPARVKEEVMGGLKLEARGDEAFLPHYERARFVGPEQEYPLLLNLYQPITSGEGNAGNQPWLLEMDGLPVRQRWNSWIELHPDTAHDLGILDGEEVWVESPRGKVKTVAKVYPGAMRQVVNMPLGFGHRALGRWAKDRGANPLEIVVPEYDHLGGLEAWLATRVKVYRA